jgi:hypothetical protein
MADRITEAPTTIKIGGASVTTADLQIRIQTPDPPRPVAPGDEQGPRAPAQATQTASNFPTFELSKPQDIVHCLLFIVEYSNSADPRWQEHKRHLNLFFSRDGGLHLLLMLLNAYYNKPAAGRRPGWVFSGMRDRIQISERGLRMLINDAMGEKLIEQLPITGSLDRRCRSYRLTLPVIEAWEALSAALRTSMRGVLDQFEPGALANVDYRKWDPAVDPSYQVDPRPPSHRLRRRG